MWRLFVLCIGAASASMIQLDDKDFDDDDKHLARLLEERMKGGVQSSLALLPPDREAIKNFEENILFTIDQIKIAGVDVEPEETGEGNETRRQANKPALQRPNTGDTQKTQNWKTIVGVVVPEEKAGLRQKSYLFPNIPENKELKERIMEMMQHHIYSTQYRLRDLQKVADKYSGDLNYRVAFIFCRLETILTEMKVTHSFMSKTVHTNSCHVHMIYYTYFMKKNIDVTYIVEHLIRVHDEYLESLKKRVSKLAGGRGKSKKGGSNSTTTSTEFSPAQKVAGAPTTTPEPSETQDSPDKTTESSTAAE